jgi:predicted PurR-regulated permease PerM
MPGTGSDQARLRQIVFYGTVLLVGYFAFKILKPFFGPLAWAGVLAVPSYPLFKRLSKRLRAPRAAALVTVLIGLLIVVPGVLISSALVNQGSQALDAVRDGLNNVERQERIAEWVTAAQARFGLPSLSEINAQALQVASKGTTWIVGQAGTLLRSVLLFFFQLVVTLFALFFFLRDSARISEEILRLIPFDAQRASRVVQQTRDLVFAGVTTSLSVAAAQGTAGGVIFWALGFDAPIFWGVVMGVCSFIPVVGASIVWAPAAIALALTGHWMKGLLLAGLGVGVIGVLDNLLRPLLMSGRSSMNMLLMALSLLGGLAAFGLLGLVLGPVVVAILVSLLSAVTGDDHPA